MIRIIIGDDHELIRNGFARLLQAEPDMKLVGEAGTAAALFPLLENTRADVLVLDIELPDMNGLEILKGMKSRGITLKTLVMSMHPEGRYAKRALQNGAAGYITKDSASEELELAEANA